MSRRCRCGCKPACARPASTSERSPNGSPPRRSAPATSTTTGAAIRISGSNRDELIGAPAAKAGAQAPPRPGGASRSSPPRASSASVFSPRMCEALYDELTRNRSRFIRLEDLVFAAADAVPGLTPTAAQVAAEAELLAARQGRRRDRPGHLSRPCARPARPPAGISATPCCCRAPQTAELLAEARRRRRARSRHGQRRAPRQGGVS